MSAVASLYCILSVALHEQQCLLVTDALLGLSRSHIFSVVGSPQMSDTRTSISLEIANREPVLPYYVWVGEGLPFGAHSCHAGMSPDWGHEL